MNVLLIEDDSKLREGLASALKSSELSVTGAENGRVALQYFNDHPFDAVILDLCLPDIDGWGVLKALREQKQTCPVVIISALDRVEERIGALDAGADDFLVKPFSVRELEARLAAVMRRKLFYSAHSVQIGNLNYDVGKRRVKIGNDEVNLSPRELTVLEVFLRHRGRVVSKEMLLERLSEHDREITFNAVEVYVHRLRKKLDGSGLHINTLRGIGYLIDELQA